MKYSLEGIDGNAYVLLGHVRICMRKSGKNRQEAQTFADEAKSGDYDHLVKCCQAKLDELNKDPEDLRRGE